ncbi:helix-turn-helix domain-containing protein [Austwickia chelonae]|uniref:helix-turn-helix domain-containing protein n=1 Tax=Austwickia chelonae TaxID=100225 RepID=UPI000E28965D|nr:hypothetical protein [Austwickia chelonae]
MVQERNRDFADALREAIESRGLSLDRVRAHLLSYGHDVSVATLSYWQTGRSAPVRHASLQALGALEVILQVPRGSLASRLPSQRSKRSGGRVATVLRHGPEEAECDRISAMLGVAWDDGFRRVCQEEFITIGADRAEKEHSVTDVIVADRDGFDRLLVGYYSDIPGVLPVVGAGHGCTVGRVVSVLRETLTVAELILDQPLRAEDPYLLEHHVSYDSPHVLVRDWQRLHLKSIYSHSVTVSFPPECPPSRQEFYVGRRVPDMSFRPVSSPSPELTIYTRHDEPGTIAVRWSWDDDPAELEQPTRRFPDGSLT